MMSTPPSVCLSVCLSVCPSHTGILSKRPNVSSSVFHRSSFFIPDGMAIFRRESPPIGGIECRGYEKNAIFRPMYHFISEIIHNTVIVNIECEQETTLKLLNILYSPRMVEEIKEEKIGTSNKQTVIWPNYLNYLNYKKKKKKFICQCRKKLQWQAASTD